MSKFQIDLDMVLETTRNAQNRICVQGQVREDIERHKLNSVIIEESGPAGGWPIVRLSGTHVAIEGYLREFYAQDAVELQFQISRIKPYEGGGVAATLG